jgi:hypothetical protein
VAGQVTFCRQPGPSILRGRALLSAARSAGAMRDGWSRALPPLPSWHPQIFWGSASQTRHDFLPQSTMIRGCCHRVWWAAGDR